METHLPWPEQGGLPGQAAAGKDEKERMEDGSVKEGLAQAEASVSHQCNIHCSLQHSLLALTSLAALPFVACKALALAGAPVTDSSIAALGHGMSCVGPCGDVCPSPVSRAGTCKKVGKERQAGS